MFNSAVGREGPTLRVAIIGAGPSGIYAADALARAGHDFTVKTDLFDQYPTPYGLVRYGVAPDHPRIKGVVVALDKVLDRSEIRFFGNVKYGRDLSLPDLRQLYDAVIFATGAVKDAELDIPGAELKGSFGAADFISWYDGHPDVSREWSLDAKEVAVLGNGNVALDIARILSKNPEDLLTTEIPENVYRELAASSVTDVHLFGRRGPSQVKFTPLELRELSHSRDVDIVLYPEDFEFDQGSDQTIKSSSQVKTMVGTLTNWLAEEQNTGASRRLHLHFWHNPVEIVSGTGDMANNAVGINFERNAFDGAGNVRGTGEIVEYPVQAVYRAVGYFGSPLPEVDFDQQRGVIPNVGGRVIGIDGEPILGVYTTGWIKRGPVGLIGHTKGDAKETVNCLLEDSPELITTGNSNENTVIGLLEERGVQYTTWEGWHRLDEHERKLGMRYGKGENGEPVVQRDRVKVVAREEMVRISRKLT